MLKKNKYVVSSHDQWDKGLRACASVCRILGKSCRLDCQFFIGWMLDLEEGGAVKVVQ